MRGSAPDRQGDQVLKRNVADHMASTADPVGRSSNARSRKLEDELLQLLAKQSERVPIATLLAALIICALAFDYVPHFISAAWLGAVILVLAVRFAVLRRLPAMQSRSHESRIRIAVSLSILNGFVHAASLFFFPFLPELERAIHTVILVSLSTGAVATTAGYLPLFVGYMLPAFGAMVPLWIFSPGLPDAGLREAALGLLIFMFGCILAGLARDAWRVFKESFNIRSEVMKLNEQLSKALTDAEAANNAKTRFLASASHDLRQPIHTLSLFGAALSMRKLDPDTRDIVNHMNVALQNMATQLDSLLDISKLDAGVMEKNVTRVDLRGMLLKLEQEYQPLCEEKNLHLKCSLLDGIYSVETDGLLLERIVRNLLSNAVKYTDKGFVHITTTRRDGQFSLRVADTGRGIAAKEQARIFEEFYQIDNPERDRSKGLGLGLSIVRRLTDFLEIPLHMQSSPGKGTTFELLLPEAGAVQDSDAGSGISTELEPSHDAARILVIDDEAAVRAGMQSLLGAMGYQVDTAEDIEQALQHAQSHPPDLVLADLRLRGAENGIDAIHSIRDIVPDVPALLISGDTAPNRLRSARLAGIDMLHKPVDVNLLRQTIQSLCTEAETPPNKRDVHITA